MKDSEKVAKVVLHEGKQVLLLKRTSRSEVFPNNWDLPGGHIAHGESLIEGLKREVYEETGLTISDVKFLYTRGQETFYKCPLPAGPVTLSREHTAHMMIDEQGIATLEEISPHYRALIESVLR